MNPAATAGAHGRTADRTGGGSGSGRGRPPPVVLVGTTASGKSETAQRVAEALGGVEIVSVDSMTVYRGMDLGTAKPSAADRAAVCHHLLDLVDPADEFTVADFQAAAHRVLAGIEGRRHRALLVGGTGLYVRAVVDDLELPGRWPEIAVRLAAEADRRGPEAMHRRLQTLDPVAAARTTPTNRRRILRALEVTLGSGRPFSSFGPGLAAYPATPFALFGLPFDASVVDRRIESRFESWMAAGLLDEVRALAGRPGGLSRTAAQALGYRELRRHLDDGLPLDRAVEEAVRRTKAFARRQWAWFRRDPRITWIEGEEDPAAVLGRALRPHGGR